MKLRCLASTKELLYGSIQDSLTTENKLHNDFIRNINSEYSYPKLQPSRHNNYDSETSKHRHNIPTKVQWLPDGGSFITITEDLGIRTFIPSPALLENANEQLIPFIRSYHPSSIITAELHPDSSIYSGFSGLLTSSNDTPLKLLNLIPKEDGSSQLIRTFNIQDEHTEAYHKIHSLCFANSSQFIAGSNKLVFIYDINTSTPIMKLKSWSGITSTIKVSNSDFLSPGSFYTGSFSNKVSLFSPEGDLISKQTLKGGNGVTQILESTNRKYLFVVSRNSQSIQILDIRMNLSTIGALESFKSDNQRTIGDLLPNSQGLIIGSSEGSANWFKDAELGISSDAPETYQLSESSVCSIAVNPQDPNVLLTAIGDRDCETPEISIQKVL